MDKTIVKQVILEQESAGKIITGSIERQQLIFIDSLVSLPHVVIISGKALKLCFSFR